jgi:hypothetical protein
VSKAMAVLNQATIPVEGDGNGACKYPTVPVELVVGTKVRFKAMIQVTGGIEIHSNGGALGVPHQNQEGDTTPVLALGQSYEKTLNAVGSFAWYCHRPGPEVGAQTVNIVAN